MFRHIDELSTEKLKGFCYHNRSGILEYVTLHGGTISIKDSASKITEIYQEDIPKLIVALQAAYDLKGT